MSLGACLCGTVRYELDGPFTAMMHCHCSMCRKQHGAPFATFVAAALSGFRWLGGDFERIRWQLQHGRVLTCRQFRHHNDLAIRHFQSIMVDFRCSLLTRLNLATLCAKRL